jgi:hypothetical protein
MYKIREVTMVADHFDSRITFNIALCNFFLDASTNFDQVTAVYGYFFRWQCEYWPRDSC